MDVEKLTGEVEIRTAKGLRSLKKWKQQVRKELSDISDETIEIEVDTKKVDKSVKKVKEQIENLDPEITIKADTKEADADIERSTRDRTVDVDVDVDTRGVDPAIDKHRRQAPIDVPVETDTEPARMSLKELQAELRKLTTASADIKIDTDTARARTNLGLLQTRIDTLEANTANIDIDVEDVEATSKLAAIQVKTAKLSAKAVDIKVDIDAAEAIAELAALNAVADDTEDELSEVDRAASGASRSLIKMAIAAGIGAAAMEGVRRAAASKAVDKHSKELRQNTRALITNNVAQKALARSVNELSRDFIKASVATRLCNGAIDSFVTGMIKAALVSALGSGAIGLLTGVVGALAVSLVALLAILTAVLVVGLLGFLTMALAAAGAAGVLMLAFKGLDEEAGGVQAALKKSLDAVKADMLAVADTVREALAPGFLAAVDILRTQLMPIIQQGLGAIAGGVGEMLKDLAQQLSTSTFKQDFSDILNGLVPIIKMVGGMIGNVVRALSSLFAGSMPYMQEFAGLFLELTNRFLNWVEKIRSDGRLQEFLETGIKGFKILTDGIAKWGGVIMGVLRLAAPLGLALLETFAASGGRLLEMVNSSSGIEAISGFFDDMKPVLTAVSELIKALAGGIMEILLDVLPLIAPTIQSLTDHVVPALEMALKILAPIGLMIIQGLAPLVPMLLPIVSLLGDLAATFAVAFIPVIQLALQEIGSLAPLFGELATAFSFAGQFISELIPPIAELIRQALPILVDLFSQLGPVILDSLAQLAPLIPLLGTELVTAVVEIVTALIPLIPIFTQLAIDLAPILAQVIRDLVPVFVSLSAGLVAIAPDLADLIIQVADFLPKVIELADSFIGWLESTDKLKPVLAALLAIMVVGKLIGFAAIFSTIGTVIGVVTSAVSGLLTIIGGFLAGGLPGVGAVLAGMFGPVGATIAVVVAAVAALGAIFYVAYQRSEPFRELVDLMWQGLQALWDVVLGVAKAVGGFLVDAFKTLWPLMSALFDLNLALFFEPIISAILIIVDLFQGDFAGAWERFLGIFTNIGDAFSKVGGIMVDIGSKMLNALWDGLVAAAPVVWDFFTALPGKILGLLVDLDAFLTEKGLELIDGLWQGAQSGWDTFIEWLKELPEKMLKGLGVAAQWLYKHGAEALTGLQDGMKSGAESVLRWLQDLPGNLLSFAGDALNWLVDTGISMLKGLVDGMTNGAIAVVQFVAGIPERITALVKDAVEWLKTTGLDILKGLVNGLQDGAVAVLEFIIGLPGMILGYLTDAIMWLRTTGVDILGGLYNGFLEGVQLVLDFFTDLPGMIFDWIGDAASWLFDTGRDLLEGLWNGINDAGDWFIDKFMGFLKALIPDPLEALFDMHSPSRVMAGYGVNIMAGLGQGIGSGANTVSTQMTNSLTQLTSAVTAYVPPPVKAPSLPVAEMTAGIDQLKNDARMKMGTLSTDLHTELANGFTNITPGVITNSVQLGTNVSIGVDNGMRADMENLATTSASMGAAIDTAFRASLLIESPSKVMMDSGQHIMTGLHDGLIAGEDPIWTWAQTFATEMTALFQSIGAVAGQSYQQALEAEIGGSLAGDQSGIKRAKQKVNQRSAEAKIGGSLAGDQRGLKQSPAERADAAAAAVMRGQTKASVTARTARPTSNNYASAGYISDGKLPDKDKGKDKEPTDLELFFAFLEHSLATRANVNVDWKKMNELALQLANVPGWKTIALDRDSIRVLDPKRRYFTMNAAAGTRDSEEYLEKMKKPPAAKHYSFANGGLLPKQALIKKPTTNLVQWAEAGTGGEAFIPLARAKRPRSKAIWAETGRRLGLSESMIQAAVQTKEKHILGTLRHVDLSRLPKRPQHARFHGQNRTNWKPGQDEKRGLYPSEYANMTKFFPPPKQLNFTPQAAAVGGGGMRAAAMGGSMSSSGVVMSPEMVSEMKGLRQAFESRPQSLIGTLNQNLARSESPADEMTRAAVTAAALMGA